MSSFQCYFCLDKYSDQFKKHFLWFLCEIRFRCQIMHRIWMQGWLEKENLFDINLENRHFTGYAESGISHLQFQYQNKSNTFPVLLHELLFGWPSPLPISGHTKICYTELPGWVVTPSWLWQSSSYFPLSRFSNYRSNVLLVVSKTTDVVSAFMFIFHDCPSSFLSIKTLICLWCYVTLTMNCPILCRSISPYF